MPMWPQPGTDAEKLEKQDQEKKAASQKKRDPDEIYAEDWWSHARPVFEIHGYYRVRAELFHNFSLGRVDSPEHRALADPQRQPLRRRVSKAHSGRRSAPARNPPSRT